MLKQTKIDLSTTNLALFGTDVEKKIKHAASTHEKAWQNAGKVPGIDIWRIENFQVVPVPKNTYGQFYNGDSYIVLKTNKVKDALSWDVHFWLGEFTTQDEAGTAAYKTVELDDFLNGAPVEYREVAHHESAKFLSYFEPPGRRLLEGGIESGFHHVKPEEYKPRLLHLKSKGRNIAVSEVALTHTSLNSGDAFILDGGLNIYTWLGKSAGPLEKNKAAQLARALDDEREGKPQQTVFNEGDSDAAPFWSLLGGEGPVKSAAEGDAEEKTGPFTKVLHRLSDGSGSLKDTKVAEGNIRRSQFESSDVFFFDTGAEVFVWVGKHSDASEKKAAFHSAQTYLKDNNRPVYLPIVRILEGGENEVFISYLSQ